MDDLIFWTIAVNVTIIYHIKIQTDINEGVLKILNRFKKNSQGRGDEEMKKKCVLQGGIGYCKVLECDGITTPENCPFKFQEEAEKK